MNRSALRNRCPYIAVLTGSVFSRFIEACIAGWRIRSLNFLVIARLDFTADLRGGSSAIAESTANFDIPATPGTFWAFFPAPIAPAGLPCLQNRGRQELLLQICALN